MWGAYPTGSSLTIKFVDGIHKYGTSVRFGWVVNQQLAMAVYTYEDFVDGILSSGIGGNTGGGWITVSNPGYNHNSLQVNITGGVVSGVLIVQSFTVDDPVSGAGSEYQDAHIGL